MPLLTGLLRITVASNTDALILSFSLYLVLLAWTIFLLIELSLTTPLQKKTCIAIVLIMLSRFDGLRSIAIQVNPLI